MRRLLTIRLAAAMPALLAVAVLATCGDDDGDEASTTELPSTTDTTSTTEAPVTTESTTSTDTTPPVASCDQAAVRDAIANSDAGPGPSFEFTHLKCAEGFGWAVISTDIGESATVLFKASGTDIELLNLGTSVCTTDAGIPADVAAQLAPPGKDPLGDCP